MKICVVSDSHDRAPMLAAAVAAGRDAGAEHVVHCGDVIGANTLRPLLEIGLPVHVVHGNNLGTRWRCGDSTRSRAASSPTAGRTPTCGLADAASSSRISRTMPEDWPAPGL